MLRQWFLLSATLAVALFVCHLMACVAIISLWLVFPALALAPLMVACSVVGVIVGVCWLGWFTDSLFTVAETTSVGVHRIEEWPQCAWWDGFGSRSTLFVVNALAIAAVAAYELDRCVTGLGLPQWLVIASVVALLFPLILLSMMEADSTLQPISFPVWQSLFTDWPAWGLFYLTSTSLVDSIAWAVWRTWQWAGDPFRLFAWHGPMLAPILAAGLLAYFRLLGLLALACAKRAAQRDLEAE